MTISRFIFIFLLWLTPLASLPAQEALNRKPDAWDRIDQCAKEWAVVLLQLPQEPTEVLAKATAQYCIQHIHAYLREQNTDRDSTTELSDYLCKKVELLFIKYHILEKLKAIRAQSNKSPT